MQKRAVLVHKCETTKGRKVTTQFALGQVWKYKGVRHVVAHVYPTKVLFDCGDYLLTVGQVPFAKHAKLILNTTVSK